MFPNNQQYYNAYQPRVLQQGESKPFSYNVPFVTDQSLLSNNNGGNRIAIVSKNDSSYKFLRAFSHFPCLPTSWSRMSRGLCGLMISTFFAIIIIIVLCLIPLYLPKNEFRIFKKPINETVEVDKSRMFEKKEFVPFSSNDTLKIQNLTTTTREMPNKRVFQADQELSDNFTTSTVVTSKSTTTLKNLPTSTLASRSNNSTLPLIILFTPENNIQSTQSIFEANQATQSNLEKNHSSQSKLQDRLIVIHTTKSSEPSKIMQSYVTPLVLNTIASNIIEQEIYQQPIEHNNNQNYETTTLAYNYYNQPFDSIYKTNPQISYQNQYEQPSIYDNQNKPNYYINEQRENSYKYNEPKQFNQQTIIQGYQPEKLEKYTNNQIAQEPKLFPEKFQQSSLRLEDNQSLMNHEAKQLMTNLKLEDQFKTTANFQDFTERALSTREPLFFIMPSSTVKKEIKASGLKRLKDHRFIDKETTTTSNDLPDSEDTTKTMKPATKTKITTTKTIKIPSIETSLSRLVTTETSADLETISK